MDTQKKHTRFDDDPQMHNIFLAMADEHEKSLSDLMDESGSDHRGRTATKDKHRRMAGTPLNSNAVQR